MQKIIAFLLVTGLITITATGSQAQHAAEPTTIEAFPLEITDQKTTNLVFAHNITSVDKGSQQILAQKAKGAANILQLKAAAENFQQTNLTVITTDGKLYSFLLDYSPFPAALNYVFSGGRSAPAVLSEPAENEGIIQETAASAAEQKKTIKRKRDKKFGIIFQLDGLYIKDDVLYYQLRVKNNTQLSYDIDQLRFFIRDKKTSRRTANQELEIQPLYVEGNTDKIQANSENVLVYAVPKHTVPDKKYLSLQLMENNGGRHLQLKVRNRTLIKALPL